jgi:transcription elongation factor Elf1
MDYKQLKDFLTRIDATLPCHRCGNPEFAIVDGKGEFAIKNFQGKGVEQTLPVMFVVCSTCGAVTPHAMGAIDTVLSEGAKPN